MVRVHRGPPSFRTRPSPITVLREPSARLRRPDNSGGAGWPGWAGGNVSLALRIRARSGCTITVQPRSSSRLKYRTKRPTTSVADPASCFGSLNTTTPAWAPTARARSPKPRSSVKTMRRAATAAVMASGSVTPASPSSRTVSTSWPAARTAFATDSGRFSSIFTLTARRRGGGCRHVPVPRHTPGLPERREPVGSDTLARSRPRSSRWRGSPAPR